ncbi:UNVERIFIED_CONTAM: Sodium transporter HKT1 [Sesamum angustifolium]|uniref:Sodium transporter HKT1 n=1 Tax=Sesamum angustifolium TaxID=2727405 RepID=A0AAW2N568_9LAMI
MTKRAEFRYMLKKWRGLGYGHLLSGLHSLYLAITVLGFIAVQLVMFCLVEWNSEATVGLSAYEKLVGSLFQVVNSRHAGETVSSFCNLPSHFCAVCPRDVSLFIDPLRSYLVY